MWDEIEEFERLEHSLDVTKIKGDGLTAVSQESILRNFL